MYFISKFPAERSRSTLARRRLWEPRLESRDRQACPLFLQIHTLGQPPARPRGAKWWTTQGTAQCPPTCISRWITENITGLRLQCDLKWQTTSSGGGHTRHQNRICRKRTPLWPAFPRKEVTPQTSAASYVFIHLLSKQPKCICHLFKNHVNVAKFLGVIYSLKGFL